MTVGVKGKSSPKRIAGARARLHVMSLARIPVDATATAPIFTSTPQSHACINSSIYRCHLNVRMQCRERLNWPTVKASFTLSRYLAMLVGASAISLKTALREMNIYFWSQTNLHYSMLTHPRTHIVFRILYSRHRKPSVVLLGTCSSLRTNA